MKRGLQKQVARAGAPRRLSEAEREALYADMPEELRYWMNFRAPAAKPAPTPPVTPKRYVPASIRRQWTPEVRAWLRNLRPSARAWMALLKQQDRPAWQRIIDDRNAEFIAAKAPEDTP